MFKKQQTKRKTYCSGGHSDRGVIASYSYEARNFGVKSTMPVRLAKRLCSELFIVRGEMDRYSKYSRLVTEIVAGQVPLFEKSSIDQFYINMSGMDKFFGCSQYSHELRDTIKRESGLNISYCLSSNKLISKVATNEVKPHGQIVIPFGEEKAYLAPLAIEKMPMVGGKTSELLRGMA